MKHHSVDPIQIFCVNFRCDLDLRLPPGGNPRYIHSVKWPSFEDFCHTNDQSAYDRKNKYQLIEIFLKNSRYSIETVQLVLSEPNKYPHLQHAILFFYSKSDPKDFFHSESIIDALNLLELINFDIDNRVELIKSTDAKFNSWLNKAISICKG